MYIWDHSSLLSYAINAYYDNNTVLGRWLRSKNTLVKINDDVFVHGGVSKNFITKNDFSLEKINAIMRASLDRTKEEM